MASKIIMYFILSLLMFPFSLSIVHSSNNPSLQIIHQNYLTVFSVSKSSLMGNNSLIQITYEVNKETFNNIVSGNVSNIMITTTNSTVYLFTVISHNIAVYNALINVTINGELLEIYSGIPDLIKVTLYSGGQAQIVWAGYLSSPSYVKGYAYINGSGTLTLQYLNGSSLLNININVSANSKIIKRINVTLLNINSTIKESHILNSIIGINLPNRYQPYLIEAEFNSTIYKDFAPYNLAYSYFSTTLLPSMVWKANNNYVNFTAIEFFGVNSTLVSFVKIASIEKIFNLSSFNISYYTDIQGSDLLIIKYLNTLYYNPMYLSKTFLNGKLVLLAFSPNNYVESSANITLDHQVYLNGRAGEIVNITLNNSYRLVAIFTNNNSYNVTLITPSNIINTNITIGNTVFFSQKLIINYNSSFILISIRPKYTTGIIVVKQLQNGSIVFLNSSNYFISNGKLYIFDDSTTIYYIVYTSQQITTLAQHSVTQSPYNNNGQHLTVSSNSSLIITRTSSDETNLVIISGILIILLIIISIVVIRRKK
jgi:hypothetical protein